MNREAHLRQSLPLWLSLPKVDEVVIVDWSNSRPLVELARMDQRIRVVRVEGEPRWILSYAYNVGVTRTSGSVIFKCDADCSPHPEVTDLEPGPAHFYAGYWKSGRPLGKAWVNGQCLFSRAQFDAVNGYSEFIRTYGRDDEDFYDRLAASGFARREIDASLLDFIEHEQDARMANQVESRAADGIEGLLKKDPNFNEIRNFFFTKLLPWGRDRLRAPYAIVESGERWEVVRRDKTRELPIPEDIQVIARLNALRHAVSQLIGLPQPSAAKLDAKACLALLSNRLFPKSAPGQGAPPKPGP